VVEGLDAVRLINGLPAGGAAKKILDPPVVIRSAVRA
jgi:hypothetical protein